jgi:hypothetical protein
MARRYIGWGGADDDTILRAGITAFTLGPGQVITRPVDTEQA